MTRRRMNHEHPGVAVSSGDDVDVWTNNNGETVHMLVEIGPCEEGKWVSDGSSTSTVTDESYENIGEHEVLAAEENDCIACFDVEATTADRSSSHEKIDEVDSPCSTDDCSVCSSDYADRAFVFRCDTHHNPDGDPLCTASSATENQSPCNDLGDSRASSAAEIVAGLSGDILSSRDQDIDRPSSLAIPAEHPESSTADRSHDNANDIRGFSEDVNPVNVASACSTDTTDNGDLIYKPASESSLVISVGSAQPSANASCSLQRTAVGSDLAGPFGDCCYDEAAGGSKTARGSSHEKLPIDGSTPKMGICNDSVTNDHFVVKAPSCLGRSSVSDQRSPSTSHTARADNVNLPSNNHVFQARRHPGGALENFRIINSSLPPNSVEKSAGSCSMRLEIRSDGCSTRFRRLEGSTLPSELPPGFSSLNSDVGINRRSVCDKTNNNGRLLVTPSISTDVPSPVVHPPRALTHSTPSTTSGALRNASGVALVTTPASAITAPISGSGAIHYAAEVVPVTMPASPTATPLMASRAVNSAAGVAPVTAPALSTAALITASRAAHQAAEVAPVTSHTTVRPGSSRLCHSTRASHTTRENPHGSTLSTTHRASTALPVPAAGGQQATVGFLLIRPCFVQAVVPASSSLVSYQNSSSQLPVSVGCTGVLPDHQPVLQAAYPDHARSSSGHTNTTPGEHNNEMRSRPEAKTQPKRKLNKACQARPEMSHSKKSRPAGELPQSQPAHIRHAHDSGQPSEASSAADQPIPNPDTDRSKEADGAAGRKYCTCCHLRFCPHQMH